MTRDDLLTIAPRALLPLIEAALVDSGSTVSMRWILDNRARLLLAAKAGCERMIEEGDAHACDARNPASPP